MPENLAWAGARVDAVLADDLAVDQDVADALWGLGGDTGWCSFLHKPAGRVSVLGRTLVAPVRGGALQAT